MKRNLKVGKRLASGIDFRVLSEADLDDIHAATLEVLWKTGIFVEGEEALDIFAESRANVDFNSKIVKIPPYLLEDAVTSAPEIVLLAGREPQNDVL
jgi:trimethylamine--corrinoid protein Co-methyltransferase